jgi:hypothetical protein
VLDFEGPQEWDGALQLLIDIIATLVPDPQDRATLGDAIDTYIACREDVLTAGNSPTPSRRPKTSFPSRPCAASRTGAETELDQLTP